MSIIEGTLLISETLILHLGLFAYNLIILNNALMNNVDSERLGYYLSEQTIEILENLSYHLGFFSVLTIHVNIQWQITLPVK